MYVYVSINWWLMFRLRFLLTATGLYAPYPAIQSLNQISSSESVSKMEIR